MPRIGDQRIVPTQRHDSVDRRACCGGPPRGGVHVTTRSALLFLLEAAAWTAAAGVADRP